MINLLIILLIGEKEVCDAFGEIQTCDEKCDEKKSKFLILFFVSFPLHI